MTPALVIGSGGREFTLAEKLTTEVETYAVPGSDGIERSLFVPSYRLPKDVNLNSPQGFGYVSEVASLLAERGRTLVVVGPEDPLVGGISDYLQREGYLVFGPRQAASIVEASKCWSAEFMQRNGVPAPNFYNPESHQHALRYVRIRGLPLVIKGDELAQGKGVTIVRTLQEAEEALYTRMINRELGGPGVNIQDWIDIDYELSAMAIVDVRKRNGSFTGDYKLLLYSMDHKPVFDNDEGPNTGGMGAVAPLPLREEMKRRIVSAVIEPTIEGFVKEGIEFTGCLYPALAVDKKGDIWTLEYNIRFADPETQVVLDLMESSLHDYLMAATLGELHRMPEIKWKDGYSVIVNLTSYGYPNTPKGGFPSFPIDGLDEKGQLKEKVEGVTVIHAGTKYEDERWFTNGGRVLGVRARDQLLRNAISKSYQHSRTTSFGGKHQRNDIGKKALELSSSI